MTVRQVFLAVCDGCGFQQALDLSNEPFSLIDSLEGWTAIREGGQALDLCPACADDGPTPMDFDDPPPEAA